MPPGPGRPVESVSSVLFREGRTTTPPRPMPRPMLMSFSIEKVSVLVVELYFGMVWCTRPRRLARVFWQLLLKIKKIYFIFVECKYNKNYYCIVDCIKRKLDLKKLRFLLFLHYAIDLVSSASVNK